MARWAPAAEEEVAGGRPDHTGERETEREGEERNRGKTASVLCGEWGEVVARGRCASVASDASIA
jgi:hypothetical protein